MNRLLASIFVPRRSGAVLRRYGAATILVLAALALALVLRRYGRQTVDRNVGDSPTAVHARESPELPEPKPAPHRAYQRWRGESQDHDLEHLW